MSKLWMVAGREVEDRDATSRFGAFVVLSAGRLTRIFHVRGTAKAQEISELPPATTVDMSRFDAELTRDLPAPAGTKAKKPDEAFVFGVLRSYLKKSEKLDVD
jgi:hypothetical protein